MKRLHVIAAVLCLLLPCVVAARACDYGNGVLRSRTYGTPQGTFFAPAPQGGCYSGGALQLQQGLGYGAALAPGYVQRSFSFSRSVYGGAAFAPAPVLVPRQRLIIRQRGFVPRRGFFLNLGF